MNNEGKDNTVGTMIECGDLCGDFSCNQKELVLPFVRNISRHTLFLSDII